MANRISMYKNSSNDLLGYAGDVTSLETWEVLKKDKKSVLIDTRTIVEWSFVGLPVLASLGKEVIQISWRIYPTMQINGKFIQQMHQVGIKDVNTPIYLLCRSGGRSKEAAIYLTQNGFVNCYNVVDGFEGNLNRQGHRNEVNGWKHSNLPWEQT